MDNTVYKTESELLAESNSQTYSITLTADQRKLLMYTILVLGGYFMAKHLINSAVKKIRDD